MMRKKQEKIFIEFIDQYKKRFYLLALTYTKNEQDALDVVQESLSKAWKSFPTLKDHSQLKSWFFQILVRTAIDFLRKQKKICLMEDDQIEYFSPNQVDTYTNIDLHTALNNLPYQFSEIIILRFFEDFKIGFYYICWGIKTIHVVTFRKNECFPPTSAALFLSTLGGKKGLLHTCFSAGVLVISFNIDLCEKWRKKAQFHQFLYT
ncbi:RNA polymerase sigma factor [Kurthia zopfii]|uniref:RNA polymerase sigma factor n=1 Tax=Kurthia zopfii TaxID=1650 RepID=UPI000F717A39|nr:sigma-70 family RNA polymerase sigma factor [Kurthia zopfii]VEI05182.1 RNA polymerase sigma factor sigV [Kurthia zopfii]